MKKNIFDDIPNKIEEELIETLVRTKNIKIERIISDNHSSPENFWYDQDKNEFVIVLQGEGTILFEDGNQVTLKKNEYLNIPAHFKHRVEGTSSDEKTIWLAIFYE